MQRVSWLWGSILPKVLVTCRCCWLKTILTAGCSGCVILRHLLPLSIN